MDSKKTLVLGASTNPSRYSYIATHRLLENGHEVIPVGIKHGEVAGLEIKNDFDGIEEVDTLTLYVGPQNQGTYIDPIIDLKPKRVIFNPGTYNPDFIRKLEENGIETVEACTLVMLSAGTY
ncbi:MAG: CoA-binding protein [Flavobacteriales bacterium]|nr:CoA-binding protein [Flavobacteriales bacterium]|tara:strand:+ start:596 stop:961 length:366 start_codon:yes stop_codon:yes gene_type:complete